MSVKYFFFTLFAASLLVAPIETKAFTPNDQDYDGLIDSDELTVYFTDPRNPDTDGDGYHDGLEIVIGYSPLHPDRQKLSEVDTDNDKLSDGLEIALGTNLTKSDTDDDGHSDAVEMLRGFNPLVGGGNRDVKRHVEVDLTTQQLTYFMNDIKIGSIPVSTGRTITPTPLGEFEIMRKVFVKDYVGADYFLPNTKWNLEFKRSYYLHGAYWHDQFGVQPMSHGCVNIAYKDAEQLYTYLDAGDRVVITGVTPRGKVVAAAVSQL